MKNILVTGGTVFVSRYVAEYFAKQGHHVFVLNRNTKPQSDNVTLLQADRNALGTILKGYHFDAVLDVTAYKASDVDHLLDALGSYDDYILISSSAVYPEYASQPFAEDTPVGANKYWGAYGVGKIEAEKALLQRNPNAYILRPPYLYGQMNNVYREAFVFDCALLDRKFYLPGQGKMQLQFFHVEDLCRFMDILLTQKPAQHIFNVGNPETVSIAQWAALCYAQVGKEAEFVNVETDADQRNYFSFYNYEYFLDVRAQQALMPDTTPLAKGLQLALQWYREHPDAVRKKPLMAYIDEHFV